MSLNNTLKSLFTLTAITVFAFTVAIVPSTHALSGGVSPPSDVNVGKCADSGSPADRSKCLKDLIKKQKTYCQQLKDKKESAKAKACVETVNSQVTRLKTVNEKLKAQIAEAKKVKVPKDYQECLVRVAPIDDTSDMRDKINKSYNTRTKALANLQKRVDKLTNEGAKTAMTNALTSDKAILDFYKAGSTQTDSPSALQAMYCQSIFRLQINNFRNTQVNMIKNVDQQLKYDQARNELFNNPVNLSTYPKLASNPLRNEVTTRLDTSRQLTQANLVGVATAYMQVVGAKVNATGSDATLNYKADLSGPKSVIVLAKANRTAAMRNYDEAQVLRKVGNSLSNDRTYTVSSVTLKNSKGDVISADGKVALGDKTLESCQVKVDGADDPAKTATATNKVTAKELKDCRDKLKKNTQPRKATVVVKSGGKEYTKQLSRPDKVTVWKIQN